MAIRRARAAEGDTVIGFLCGASPGPYNPYKMYVVAFHQGLSETGYVEGQNLAIEALFDRERSTRFPNSRPCHPGFHQLFRC